MYKFVFLLFAVLTFQVLHAYSPEDAFISKELPIHKMGYGTLQLSYPEMNKTEAGVLLSHAANNKLNFFATAAVYGGDRHNEKLLGDIFKDRNDVVLSTKCGIDFVTKKFTQTPAEINESIEISLKNLHKKQLDLVYLHRLDPNASAAEFNATIASLKNLVITGKAKYVGLSEPTHDQLEKAIAAEPRIVPIAAVECAYSIFTRRAEENQILETCKKNKILFVSYTSILRGLASPKLKELSVEDVQSLPIDVLKKKFFDLLNIDFVTQSVGWFQDEYIRDNIAHAQRFVNEAERLHMTPAQLSLAWSIAQGALPIPGMINLEQVDENVIATELSLSQDDIKRLSDLFPYGSFKGVSNPVLLKEFNNDNVLEKKN